MIYSRLDLRNPSFLVILWEKGQQLKWENKSRLYPNHCPSLNLFFLSEDSLQCPKTAQRTKQIILCTLLEPSQFYTTSSKLGNLSFSSLWSDLVKIIIPSIINILIILGSVKRLWKPTELFKVNAIHHLIIFLYLKEITL